MDADEHGWGRVKGCLWVFVRGWVLVGLICGVRAETGWEEVLKGGEENRVAMVSGGYDALLLRVHLIRAAKVSVDVQTFIWGNDECGRLVMWELIEAARRGVKVRIIADHLFSDQDPETAAFLATVHPNLEVRHHRPTMKRIKPTLAQTMVAGARSFRGINQRMHNKVMLFDGAVLITGGRNIENGYFDHATELNFRDRDVVVAGPAARTAGKSFEAYWNFKHVVPSRELGDVAAVIERGAHRRFERKEDWAFGGFFGALDGEAEEAGRRLAERLRVVERAEFLADEPGKKRGWFIGKAARITRELTETIQGARERIVIQTPYLVLSNRAQELFRQMRRENPGLRIEISTNSFAATDNIMAYSANYRLRNRYVQDLGLSVFEFKPEPAAMAELFPRRGEMAERARPLVAAGRQERMPFLCVHAKSMTIDGRVAFVGSYNLDPRSENLNTEVGLLVEDEVFARDLQAEIERDMRPENSWAIARRRLPLRMEVVNGLVGGVLSLSPLDVWPIQNTSSFELRAGEEPVPMDDPRFYERYEEVGAFPGTEGVFTTKEILTRLYKAVGPALNPVL
jgi:Phosphatidylserine/phosphatidylglycerophosphate/cardiolipin synthases and related enzymes